MTIKKALITGANVGLGKECARQLSQIEGVEKVYLACRNPKKAEAAKADLEAQTGKKMFEIVIMDTSDLSSVRKAVESVEPIDALVMNAGGPLPSSLTSDGVTQTFAANVLGHVVLTDALLKAGKLSGVAMYASTEAVRGVPEFGLEPPKCKEFSVEEFKAVADGSFFGGSKDNMEYYGATKLVGTLWMSFMARRYPTIRFVSMSPGATAGTDAANNLPFFKRLFFKVMMWLGGFFGVSHGVADGAKRYIDVLVDDSYKTGIFYASKKGAFGPVGDQVELYNLSELKDPKIQSNAREAIDYFIAMGKADMVKGKGKKFQNL